MGKGEDERQKFDILKPFTPPGPVAEAYMKSEGPFDFIIGPWGSGKTTATVFKIARHSTMLFPVCRDGVVHVRCAAIRDTYRELAKTALSSWHNFFPKRGIYTARDAAGKLLPEAYSGGIDRPVKHIVEWDAIRQWPAAGGRWEPRETKVRLEMEFGAIGEANLDSFFKGYEVSMFWLNECDLLHEDVPGRAYGRTARFPPRDDIMPWEGERLGWETDPDSGQQAIKLPRIVMGDYNPPDETNWTYKRHIEEPEKWPSYHFFQQPSGLSPLGENRIGKTRAQYEEEEKAFGGPKAPDAIRNVHGRYAAKKEGTIIYDTFDLTIHRTNELLKPLPNLPFYLGLDGGGRPACAIAQFPNGRLRALREITSQPDKVTGAKRFAGYILDVLLEDFRGLPCGGAYGDPADFSGADTVAGELAFMQTVSQALSIPIMPTETNEIDPRLAALRYYLEIGDGGRPRSDWDPRLKMTLRGFVSQYHLTKHATEGKTTRTEIDKNQYSHIMNAWEYLCLGYRGLGKVIKDGAQLGRPANVTPIRSVTAKSDFDVFRV
jgi:hypothetical protein